MPSPEEIKQLFAYTTLQPQHKAIMAGLYARFHTLAGHEPLQEALGPELAKDFSALATSIERSVCSP